MRLVAVDVNVLVSMDKTVSTAVQVAVFNGIKGVCGFLKEIPVMGNDNLGKIQVLKQTEAVLSQEVTTVRNQELAVLQQQVRGIIDDIAKKGKYDLVLSEGVAYVNPKHDITDKVLDKMKAAFKKK